MARIKLHLRPFAQRALTKGLLLIFSLGIWSAAHGEGYLTQEEFLAQAFADKTYAKNKLWLSGPVKDQVRVILGHDYPGLRLSYWQHEGRSAWVLDEIGKERPITIGVVVDGSEISQISILEFRESRGWEVRYDFFTKQFQGVKLTADKALDKMIDGVTGATLSVRAVKKVAALALYLHSQAIQGT